MLGFGIVLLVLRSTRTTSYLTMEVDVQDERPQIRSVGGAFKTKTNYHHRSIGWKRLPKFTKKSNTLTKSTITIVSMPRQKIPKAHCIRIRIDLTIWAPWRKESRSLGKTFFDMSCWGTSMKDVTLQPSKKDMPVPGTVIDKKRRWDGAGQDKSKKGEGPISLPHRTKTTGRTEEYADNKAISKCKAKKRKKTKPRVLLHTTFTLQFKKSSHHSVLKPFVAFIASCSFPSQSKKVCHKE